MTVGTILLLCWLVPCIVTIPLAAKFIYDAPRKPVKYGNIRGGNKRTATVIGILYGIEWPILLGCGLIALFIDWCAAGDSDD